MAPLSNKIHLLEPPNSVSRVDTVTRTYLIFYVSGNPGLIEYYRIFLTHLYGLLKIQRPDCDFEVYGRSLPGFEIGEPAGGADGTAVTGPPYNVNQEIDFTIREVKTVVKAAKANGKKDVRVIVMGHSLGTYMSMEIIRRLREEARDDPDGDDSIRVVGGVLLFATVMELAKSPSGVRLGWLFGLPSFPWLVSLLSKGLFWMPVSVLANLIRLHGDPPEAARVTAEFVKSRHGVQQSLFLANDEMTEISTDKWDEEVWGAAHPSAHPHPRPTLRFLFGKSDHWLANETRDELIRARGMNGADEEWKPKMEVDEEGWPHAFCIKHSIPVAERVTAYIEDVVQRDMSLP